MSIYIPDQTLVRTDLEDDKHPGLLLLAERPSVVKPFGQLITNGTYSIDSNPTRNMPQKMRDTDITAWLADQGLLGPTQISQASEELREMALEQAWFLGTVNGYDFAFADALYEVVSKGTALGARNAHITSTGFHTFERSDDTVITCTLMTNMYE